MLAVLLDAVAVLREHATGAYRHEQQLVDTTVRWFLAQDEAWPLSFTNVCRELGLDPARLLADLRTELAELGARALLKLPRQRVVTLSLVHSSPGAGAARSNRGR
jgi:hypothetical protein